MAVNKDQFTKAGAAALLVRHLFECGKVDWTAQMAGMYRYV